MIARRFALHFWCLSQQADGDAGREYDFLSSIEVCVIDEADTMHMQNWDHVLTVLNCVNVLPKQTRDTDFSRVQDFYLNGWGKFYRQYVAMLFIIKFDFL